MLFDHAFLRCSAAPAATKQDKEKEKKITEKKEAEKKAVEKKEAEKKAVEKKEAEKKAAEKKEKKKEKWFLMPLKLLLQFRQTFVNHLPP